ncbi:MAG: AzlC family ABC transporter permease [Acidimicrobiia bacterium]
MPDTSRPFQRLRTVDVLALLVAAIAIGVAVSPSMLEVGTPGWVVMAAAMFAYSGTGELAYASVVASGGGLGPALAAGLLVSSRFALLAMSMTGRWAATVWERVGIAHFASEPSVAAALGAASDGPDTARRVYWQVAGWLAAGWIVGSALGLAIGNAVGDIRTVGLDAVFPALFVGAIVTALRRADTAVAALGGAALALALTPVLAAGGPVLVAALAAPVALLFPSGPVER